MSLKVTGSEIIIQNANGTDKFNSNNKLVYIKGTSTGSTSVGSGYALKTYHALPSSYNPQKDIPLIYVTPTAGNGNVANQLLNSTLQLNFPVLLNFTHSTTSVQITGWDVLTGLVYGSSLEFAAASYMSTFRDVENYQTASTYISFDFKLILLSYR